MKSHLFIVGLLALVLIACGKDEVLPLPETNPISCEVKGRWIHPLGTALYEFTDSLKYDIYMQNGTFGTIADAIPNPKRWWIEGDTLVIYMSRSNIQKQHLAFDCDCNLMLLTASYNQLTWTSRFWKEGVDTSRCQ